MKTRTLQFLGSLVIILGFFACKNEQQTPTRPQQAAVTRELNYDGAKQIDLSESSIVWKGHKLLGSHTGEIQLSSGQLVFDKGMLSSGQFIADMNSIRATELMKDDDEEEEEEEEEGEGHDDRDDLANHLKNADFFDVETYPQAKFMISEVSKQAYGYLITGQMTIKDVTQEIKFPAQILNEVFKASVTIDRTKFGVKYGSGSFFDNLGDNVIKDKFDLELSLKIK